MARFDEMQSLERDLARGRLGRRDFIRRAVALGVSASAIAATLAACGSEQPATSAPAAGGAAGPTATSAAAGPAPTAAATRPAAGAATAATGPAKRGGGGTLKIIQWQGPTILNPQLSSGTKDDLVCRVVYEPLMSVDGEGKFSPVLAAGIPSVNDGSLAADGRSVTWKLKPELKWSDGQPVTAADVVFTWEYVTDKATAATSIGAYEDVEKIERVDDLTVKYSFTGPNPGWFRAAVVRLLPKHVFEKDKGEPARNSPNNLKPVGTGAYKVADFKPGDSVTYVINENYREPNKPFFDRVEIKGGGDATSAARAVLQSGDYDYAWNLQVTDQVIRQLESGGKGVAQFQAGGGIERILINFTDHNKEVDGERASLKAPHPFLTDLKVRQALALASDRETVNRTLYGRGGEVATNILYDPPRYRSNNIKAEFNVDKANALLEEAGWKKGPSGYREKGGVVMAVLYQTSINDVRQKTQEIIKASWEKIGVKVELKSIDSNVFFSSDAGNPDTLGKFYADVQMYNSFNSSPDPQSYMRAFHGKFVNTRENKWSAGNVSRYQNPAYDALWEQSKTELDSEKRAQLFIQMNDVAMQDVAHIPLNYRKVVFAHTKNLQGLNFTPWEEQYWNIGDWSKS